MAHTLPQDKGQHPNNPIHPKTADGRYSLKVSILLCTETTS
jgi:hypothetical protein